jgi:hypothetical protein
MSATKTPATGRRTTAATRTRAEDDVRKLEHISESLKAAQKDLAAIGGSVGAGIRDLRQDATKLLRDARRDLLKMRRALQRDMTRLGRDLTSAASAKPPASRRAPSMARRPAH